MTTIAIDGLNEDEFRRSIESRLRQGRPGEAVERLRDLLAPYAGPGGILPERFLTVTSDDLTLLGWNALGASLKRHDRPGRPVTAISITFGWPGEEVPVPDAEGRLNPLVETAYYTDDAYPFSQSAREDLLDGYSYHGCTWTGDCQAIDATLSLAGIDELNGALARLEARLLASEEPDEEGIRAGSLGACLLSVLLHQAVDAKIALDGLPRPLCVMAGSNGVYPYFDAPVAGFPEEARKVAEAAEEEGADTGVPGPRYSSLLVTGIRRAQKRAVLVLEETADEEAVRIAKLRGLAHGESIAEPAVPETAPDETISAAAASPLMVKRPSGQAWDFRDMLGPRDPGSGDDEPPPYDPSTDWDEEEPEEPVPDWSETGSTEFPPADPETDWPAADAPEPAPEPSEAVLAESVPPAADPEPLELARTWDEADEPAPAPAPVAEEEPDLEPEPPAADQSPRFPEPAWGSDLLRILGPGWNDDEPAEPARPADEEAPLELVESLIGPAEPDDSVPEPDAEPAFEPAEQAALAEPEAEPAEAPRPGFSLFDMRPDSEGRSLFSLPIFQKAEPPEAQEPAPDPGPPVWAQGLVWRERNAPRAEYPAPMREPPVSEMRADARGLLARLRAWWLGQR